MTKGPQRAGSLTSLLDFRCHVCGGMVCAVHDDEGRHGLLHAVPTCHTFDEMQPDEFMTAYRRSCGISDDAVDEIVRLKTN